MTPTMRTMRRAAALWVGAACFLNFTPLAAEPIVHLTGVVRTARADGDMVVLTTVTATTTVVVHATRSAVAGRDLVDAEIGLTGSWATIGGGSQEPLRRVFRVERPSQITVIDQRQIGPFDLRATSLGDLLATTTTTMPLHRVKISGTVTAQLASKVIHVTDGDHDLRVRLLEDASLSPGDHIDAVGYVGRNSSPRILVDAIFRKVAAESPPDPARVDPGRLLKRSYHNTLVRTEATIVSQFADSYDQKLVLESGGITFEAELQNQRGALPTFVPGSRVEVTGIAGVRAGSGDDPMSLRIALRDANDARVISLPTWWTVQRTLYLLGIVIVGFLSASGWIVALRRRLPVAERARMESERRYRELFEDAPAGHFVSSVDGALTACNDAFARMVGFESAAAAIGASAESLYARDDDRRAWLELLRDGTPVENRKVALKALDGRIIHALETAAVRFDECGRTSEIQGFFIDRTEQERAEAALRERDAQLQQAQKMEAIGRLAGGVAHDFNNLLTAISGYSDLAREESADRPQVVEYLDQVQKAAGTGAGLTRQLLAFSRKQVFEPAVIDLNVVVADMDKMLRRLLGEDVCLTLRTAATPLHVKADRAHLEQILVNLAVNARDAMPNGGTLKVHAYSQASSAKLSVSDSGCGMDDHTMSHLFEPFFTTKGPGQGTGLGLAMVYGAVVQSGGTISVTSEPEQGARFLITLPRVDDHVDAPQVHEEAGCVHGTETVLLVEDNDAVRALAQRMLEREGYTVLAAALGRDAMKVADSHDGPIHLLLTDVVMPEMTGIALAERLRLSRPDTPVLFMSGYADHPALKREPMPVRASVLQKPFTRSGLAFAVRQALNPRQSLSDVGCTASAS